MSLNHEIEKINSEIKLLQLKLSFLQSLNQDKTFLRNAFMEVYGVYPPTNDSDVNELNVKWKAFQQGYNYANVENGVKNPETENSKTLYRYFGDYKYGFDVDIPNFDNDEFSILDWTHITVDFIYDECEMIHQDDEIMIVKINKSQLDTPYDN